MGLLGKIKEGLNNTRASISNGVNSILNSFTKIDEELFEELEESLAIGVIGEDVLTVDASEHDVVDA